MTLFRGAQADQSAIGNLTSLTGALRARCTLIALTSELHDGVGRLYVLRLCNYFASDAVAARISRGRCMVRHHSQSQYDHHGRLSVALAIVMHTIAIDASAIASVFWRHHHRPHHQHGLRSPHQRRLLGHARA